MNFPLDTNRKLSLENLDQGEQIVVKEAVKESLEQIKMGIREKCKILKEHVVQKI